MSEPIDGEFIEVRAVAPSAVKCRCPACPVMLDPNGRYCPLCLSTCVPALRNIHSAHPAIRQGQTDARAIADGVKSAARVVDGVMGIVGAVTGKPRRRRLR